MSRRMTGTNATHDNSSRSHAFLTLEVEKITAPEDNRPLVIEMTHVHLVDLVRSHLRSRRFRLQYRRLVLRSVWLM